MAKQFDDFIERGRIKVTPSASVVTEKKPSVLFPEVVPTAEPMQEMMNIHTNELVVTDDGKLGMIDAITAQFASIHLFTFSGEVEGYGYAPETLSPEKWMKGRYPKITWTLGAGVKDKVTHFKIKAEDGRFWIVEKLREAYAVGGERDSIISVTLDLGLIGL